jgi:osmotically-inducible protein OsmY
MKIYTSLALLALSALAESQIYGYAYHCQRNVSNYNYADQYQNPSSTVNYQEYTQNQGYGYPSTDESRGYPRHYDGSQYSDQSYGTREYSNYQQPGDYREYPRYYDGRDSNNQGYSNQNYRDSRYDGRDSSNQGYIHRDYRDSRYDNQDSTDQRYRSDRQTYDSQHRGSRYDGQDSTDQRYRSDRQTYDSQHRGSRYDGQDSTDQQYRTDVRRYDDKMQYDRRDDRRTNQTNTDEDIAKEVHDLIKPGVFSQGYPNTSFEVHNGVVTLTGSVDSNEDKRKLEDSVRKINGVKQVTNKITAGNKVSYNDKENNTKVRDAEKNYPHDQAATESDRALNARIRDKISSGWFTKSYEGIILKTQNGVVTVIGVVDSNDDIKKVSDKLKDIDGVRSVNNQLSVRSKDSHDNRDRDSYENRNKGSHYDNKDSDKAHDARNKYPQDSAATESDRALNAKIRDKISGGWFTKSYEGITIRTQNGVVTIIGVVDSEDDAKKIHDKLKDVDGIRSVNNQLSVKNRKQ